MADQSVHTVQMLSTNHIVQRVQWLAYTHFELRGHVRERPLPGFKATALQTQLWTGHFWKISSPTLISEGTSGSRIALISHQVSLNFLFTLFSDSTVCSALLPLAAIQAVQAFFLSSSLTVSWIANSWTSIQLPNAQTFKQVPVTALRILKSSRSQIIILKQL